MDGISYCKVRALSQAICGDLRPFHAVLAANACIFSSKYGLQRELPLASGIGIGKIQEIDGRSILGREGFDSNRVIVLHKGSADSRQTTRKDKNAKPERDEARHWPTRELMRRARPAVERETCLVYHRQALRDRGPITLFSIFPVSEKQFVS